MMHGYSAAQIRDAEAPHLEAGEPLMALAARGLAGEIRSVLRSRPRSRAVARVVLLVGSGNNGGDALFAGAELAAEGVEVAIVPTADSLHDAGLAAALAAGAVVQHVVGVESAVAVVEGADVVVDGILGTGAAASPALRGAARTVVRAVLPLVLSPRGPAVVAVDLPSGINPDDGTVPDPLVLPADVTVTFGGCKAGLLIEPASGLAGSVRLVDIGLAADLARMEPLLRR